MRKLNEKLIKQLAIGEIAVENTGILEDLREVLRAAFPKCRASIYLAHKYYSLLCLLQGGMGVCGGHEITDLPSVPLTDFFISEPEASEPTELKWNQPVEVRDREDKEWKRGYVFGCMNPSPEAVYPFLVFGEGETNVPILFKFCRPAQAIKLTRAEYAAKLGISVEQIDSVRIVD